ncbi:TetR/AcrR family transcriptional regulator [Demequina sp.]|uniref:TetR/AcrR family transcriptional regulator n=1 Tax=Demequina sp. TaxID=2050685 RepID=UPI0025F657DE|nr:TetR/AcrR family transcriptional regulator [Demequina sp.]
MEDVKRSRARATHTHRRHTAATRDRIVGAARGLMERDGYARTSIADIAAEAEVAVQTVYNAVGSKSEVLDAVLEAAATGPDAPRRVPEFMAERGAAVATAREYVTMLAAWFAEVQPRVAPVMELIREAAGHDQRIAELERARASQRLHNYGLAADQLLSRPDARRLPRESIAAVIWSIGHPHTYAQLVGQEGWTLGEYAAWVEETLAAALIEP